MSRLERFEKSFFQHLVGIIMLPLHHYNHIKTFRKRGEEALGRGGNAALEAVANSGPGSDLHRNSDRITEEFVLPPEHFAKEKTAFNSFSFCKHLFEVLLFFKPVAKRKCHREFLDGNLLAALAAAALEDIAAGLGPGALEKSVFPVALFLFRLVAGCERHMRKRYDNTILVL